MKSILEFIDNKKIIDIHDLPFTYKGISIGFFKNFIKNSTIFNNKYRDENWDDNFSKEKKEEIVNQLITLIDDLGDKSKKLSKIVFTHLEQFVDEDTMEILSDPRFSVYNVKNDKIATLHVVFKYNNTNEVKCFIYDKDESHIDINKLKHILN